MNPIRERLSEYAREAMKLCSDLADLNERFRDLEGRSHKLYREIDDKLDENEPFGK